METLKSGHEGKFCKLNAIITYREWLDDFASPETKAVAEPIIQTEMEDEKRVNPAMYNSLIKA